MICVSKVFIRGSSVMIIMEEDELSTWEGKCIEGQVSGDLLPRWHIGMV